MPDQRILFIEPEFLIRTVHSKWMEEEGYRAVTAQGFHDARLKMAEATDNPFDLIATNIGTADFTGSDFCRELRQAGLTLPVLMQTGYNDPGHILDAMRAGASDYLCKPYSKEELIERTALLLDVPPLVSRHFAARTMSNAPTVQSYCDPIVKRALERLELIRPLPGSLPAYDFRNENEAHPLPFDEKTAAELTEALEKVRALLVARRPDLDEVAKTRAVLLQCLQTLSGWLGTRATTITDEMLKNLVKVAGVAVAAHAMGLKVDIMHLSAALGVLTGAGH